MISFSVSVKEIFRPVLLRILDASSILKGRRDRSLVLDRLLLVVLVLLLPLFCFFFEVAMSLARRETI